ncbi:AAA family ATPase [Streptomyces sp. NPDC091215]|uniref:ATP-dependent nuclease n=1 Tax=Streptomyces sp. NPDC091215 TaxID=3155192 RepID=UPI00344430BB
MEAQRNTSDADNFSVSLSGITLPGGQDINFPKPGVTVFVGPNNVGKSTMLKQIQAKVNQGAISHFYPAPTLIESADVQLTGGEGDAIAWLEKHSRKDKNPLNPTFSRHTTEAVNRLTVKQSLDSAANGRGLQSLTSFFLFYGDPWNRINFTNPVEMRNTAEEHPIHPVHALQDQHELFEELSDLSVRVFKSPLTLDLLSRMLNIRVGTPSVEAPPFDKVTSEYRDAISILPRLQGQGDGMRSFIGLMLPLITATYHVVLIDEPEAFLHPPQAAQLGKVLGQLAKDKSMQIVLATHDKNLLAGLLQSDADISIVRLDRSPSNVTTARQLSVANLRRIWSDPVLRHTNVLDGLFHKLTVLAEGDRDCTFYNAALEFLDTQQELPVPPSEILFVPSGGKGGLPVLIEVLSSASVPIAASPDLDVLNDRAFLQRLIKSYGGEWSDIEEDYNQATQPFRQPRDRFLISVILKSLNDAFKGRESDIFNSTAADEFRTLVRSKESPWKALKQYGESAWRGNPTAAAAAARLLEKLDALGIVAVRVGELEGFAPTLDVRKGPEWVPAAISGGYHEQQAAQDHLRRVVKRAVE